MTVAFNQISASILTPGQYIEFDNSAAVSGVQQQPHRVLLIGPRLSSGTAAAGELKTIRTESDGDLYFGVGSILAAMCRAFRAVNTLQECVAIAVEDDGELEAAEHTFLFTGEATAAGVVSVDIADLTLSVSVAVETTAAEAAAALEAVINAATDLPCTADASSGTLLLTMRHTGAVGNDLPMRVLAVPAGLTLVVNGHTYISTNASIEAALTVVGDTQYQTLASAYTDVSNLTLLASHLERKWGPMVAAEGHAFCAWWVTGDLEDVPAGNTLNCPWLTILVAGASQTPTWAIAAVMAALEAGQEDPALPRQTLELVNVKAPPREQDYTRDQRELLLRAGLATIVPDYDRKMRVERLVTTYTTNPNGVADASYRDLETMRTLAAIRYAVRTRISAKFSRMKLASDGTLAAPGQRIVTPSIVRMELIALMRDLEGLGWVENVNAWKAALRVERSSSDANRLDAFLPPDIINQFRVFAATIQFKL